MTGDKTVAVFVDFDDTLTTENAAQLVLKKLVPDEFARISGEYRSGDITFREYQERSFDAIKGTPESIADIVSEEVELRAGSEDLAKAISNVNGTLTVASAGLDIYILPVLEKHGLGHLEVVAGKAREGGSENGGFRYDYPFADDTRPCEGDWGTCKCKALQNASPDATIVFVGDGSTSDACAAPKADHVFARDRLLRFCRERGIEATPFEDLSVVAEFVRMHSRSETVQEQTE